jgi:hypothetical protein
LALLSHVHSNDSPTPSPRSVSSIEQQFHSGFFCFFFLLFLFLVCFCVRVVPTRLLKLSFILACARIRAAPGCLDWIAAGAESVMAPNAPARPAGAVLGASEPTARVPPTVQAWGTAMRVHRSNRRASARHTGWVPRVIFRVCMACNSRQTAEFVCATQATVGKVVILVRMAGSVTSESIIFQVCHTGCW